MPICYLMMFGLDILYLPKYKMTTSQQSLVFRQIAIKNTCNFVCSCKASPLFCMIHLKKLVCGYTFKKTRMWINMVSKVNMELTLKPVFVW